MKPDESDVRPALPRYPKESVTPIFQKVGDKASKIVTLLTVADMVGGVIECIFIHADGGLVAKKMWVGNIMDVPPYPLHLAAQHTAHQREAAVRLGLVDLSNYGGSENESAGRPS
ncbi:hypothetical protein CONPUDRAFT_73428 [Coniophora puteana RWD-64-598 SS2]|uniref:Uncharacterized protein n=1 Tax=Coniophora puteana (strain RWD-64-598) TaxID=741705 RepID=A0A5M3MNQ1_CONPW|nr:uncharacterized protein CONPUDRAFT_73428 [Coniophora puteana RWD-64-598 SS2]EIW80261.1 hypothetical protein CONPUDRAFT_73428 [Coniophora puteana RWD-64-598 SS2]